MEDAPGDGVKVFDTDKGRIAMLTCYDIGFPRDRAHGAREGRQREISLSVVHQRSSRVLRVRHCCHARTMEDQIYVVTTGTVGSLPTVELMRANTGQAAILSPNDVPFPPRGIVAEGRSTTI